MHPEHILNVISFLVNQSAHRRTLEWGEEEAERGKEVRFNQCFDNQCFCDVGGEGTSQLSSFLSLSIK